MDRNKALSIKVRRKATKDKLNTAVNLWQDTQGHITKVCKALNIHRSTFYRWLERYPDFSQKLLDVEAELNDDMRQILLDKAFKGSTAELLFYLKSRHPDFKQQRLTGFSSSIGGEKIEVIIKDY